MGASVVETRRDLLRRLAWLPLSVPAVIRLLSAGERTGYAFYRYTDAKALARWGITRCHPDVLRHYLGWFEDAAGRVVGYIERSGTVRYAEQARTAVP